MDDETRNQYLASPVGSDGSDKPVIRSPVKQSIERNPLKNNHLRMSSGRHTETASSRRRSNTPRKINKTPLTPYGRQSLAQNPLGISFVRKRQTSPMRDLRMLTRVLEHEKDVVKRRESLDATDVGRLESLTNTKDAHSSLMKIIDSMQTDTEMQEDTDEETSRIILELKLALVLNNQFDSLLSELSNENFVDPFIEGEINRIAHSVGSANNFLNSSIVSSTVHTPRRQTDSATPTPEQKVPTPRVSDLFSPVMPKKSVKDKLIEAHNDSMEKSVIGNDLEHEYFNIQDNSLVLSEKKSHEADHDDIELEIASPLHAMESSQANGSMDLTGGPENDLVDSPIPSAEESLVYSKVASPVGNAPGLETSFQIGTPVQISSPKVRDSFHIHSESQIDSPEPQEVHERDNSDTHLSPEPDDEQGRRKPSDTSNLAEISGMIVHDNLEDYDTSLQINQEEFGLDLKLDRRSEDEDDDSYMDMFIGDNFEKPKTSAAAVEPASVRTNEPNRLPWKYVKELSEYFLNEDLRPLIIEEDLKSVYEATRPSKQRLPDDILDLIEEFSDAFLENQMRDLADLSTHGQRKTINVTDMVLLIKRSKAHRKTHSSSNEALNSIFTFAHGHLPLEYLNQVEKDLFNIKL